MILGANLGGARLNVSLDLLDVSFAEQLSILNQLETNLGGPPAEDQRVLVLALLRLKSANLQVHFALVARLVHLFSQDLLYRDQAARVVFPKAEDCAVGWD